MSNNSVVLRFDMIPGVFIKNVDFKSSRKLELSGANALFEKRFTAAAVQFWRCAKAKS